MHDTPEPPAPMPSATTAIPECEAKLFTCAAWTYECTLPANHAGCHEAWGMNDDGPLVTWRNHPVPPASAPAATPGPHDPEICSCTAPSGEEATIGCDPFENGYDPANVDRMWRDRVRELMAERDAQATALAALREALEAAQHALQTLGSPTQMELAPPEYEQRARIDFAQRAADAARAALAPRQTTSTPNSTEPTND